MSEYKAIALDMDGTLLTRDHQISSATRAALAPARAHGIKVLLAGTEWPFYLATLCSLASAAGFYLLRRRADRRQQLSSYA